LRHRTLDADQVAKILEIPWATVKPWVPPIACETSRAIQ
jgi:hypothetical protein